MSEHKAKERREARMADEKKEENNMVAFMACVIAAGVPDRISPKGVVKLAREILAEAHAAPSSTENGNE